MRKGDGEIGKCASPAGGLCIQADYLFPALLDLPFGHARLDRLQAGDRLNQQGILLGTFTKTFFDNALKRYLQEITDQNHERHSHKWCIGERSGDIGDQANKEENERHIDQGHQGRGAEELPQRFELTQVVCQGSCGLRFMIKAHRCHLLHQLAGDNDVGVLTGNISEIPPQVTKQEIKQVGDKNPDG